MDQSDSTRLIRNGRIIDPARGIDERGDLFIEHGVLAPVPPDAPEDAEIVDAEGLVVVPGLIDLHTHLREPGGEEAETIESGSLAAAAGGFTRVVSMPNTTPPADTPGRVRYVRERGESCGLVEVLPSGCITVDREGLVLADFAAMAEAGAVAFTDDGSTVANDDVMKAALESASGLGRPVMDHALDPGLAGAGVMREGERSEHLGLAGIPAIAEEKIVERDIRLSEATGCAIHIQHVSSGGSLDLVRSARARGVPVTCEVTPHHLGLSTADIDGTDASFKVNPPIGTDSDRAAFREGIVDGTVQALATDHAPHPAALKQCGFDTAPFGAIGLSTAVGVTYGELVRNGLMSPMDWLSLWTTGPASILGLPVPSLAPGSTADLALLDLEDEWTFDADKSPSLSRNSPFHGRKLVGRAVRTFHRGRQTFSLTRDS